MKYFKLLPGVASYVWTLQWTVVCVKSSVVCCKLWVLVELNYIASLVVALRSTVFRIIAICYEMLVRIVLNKLSYVTLCLVECTYCLWL